ERLMSGNGGDAWTRDPRSFCPADEAVPREVRVKVADLTANSSPREDQIDATDMKSLADAPAADPTPQRPEDVLAGDALGGQPAEPGLQRRTSLVAIERHAMPPPALHDHG